MEWYIWIGVFVAILLGILILYIVSRMFFEYEIPFISNTIDPLLLREKNSQKTGRLAIKTIPVKTNSETVTGAASYDTKTGDTNFIIIDEDPDEVTTIMERVPFKAKEILVEEQKAEGTESLGIAVKGKKGSETVINKMDKM